MNKLIAIVGFVTCIILASCNTTKMATLLYNLDNSSNKITVGAKVNDTLTFTMEGNPTTGYNWFCNIDSNQTDFKIIKDTYEALGTPKPDGWVGAPSNKVYQFVPLKTGTFDIIFEYKRSWEGNPSIKHKSVLVKVD